MLELFEALASGATLVTASRRLARTLAGEYDAWCRARGLRVWSRADILPLSAWLARQFEAAFDVRRPLSQYAEQLMWERAIRGSRYAEHLLQVPATARTAMAAWHLSREFRLEFPEGLVITEDVAAWMTWKRQFEAMCREQEVLPQAALADEVAALVGRGEGHLPGTLYFCGYDGYTPQQEALRAALEAAGVRLAEFVWQAGAAPDPVRVALPDAESELRAAARWCRALLEARPDARIAVIVPDLNGSRSRVERILAETLQPSALLPGAAASGLPFNISLGFPLADMALVHDALGLLELVIHRRLPLERASALIRSPFVAGAGFETAARAHLDRQLRDSREPEVTLQWLTRLSQSCPQLEAGLTRLWEQAQAVTDRQVPSVWAQHFTHLLAAVGWPGDLAYDSDAWQTLAAWKSLLDNFAALDAQIGEVGVRVAYARLADLARQTVFQPETPADVPVQVMGVLEASGMRFDALWITGLHDEVWPQAARPNPFLPLALQRERQMPQSSADRELAFAGQVTARLAKSAGQVVFSHPLRVDDRELAASPLIRRYPLAELAALPQSAPIDLRARVRQSARLETLDDQTAPPMAPDALAEGGASLFKHQAACPFRSFVQFRLHARGLQAPVLGLDASDRGNLLHEALDHFWGAVGDHARLCALPEEALDAAVREAAAHAVTRVAHQRPLTLKEKFARLERARLERLVRQWLEEERRRPPFSVVARETERVLTVGQLRVRTRIDRIDVVDGRALIIDYKTGEPRLDSWFGERPDEPQLPLYAVASEEPVAGVLFAEVRAQEMGFIGLSETSGLVPDVPSPAEAKLDGDLSDWQAVKLHWRGVIDRLADDFSRGDARVAPKAPGKTCTWCDLAPLCRIHELQGQGQEEETMEGMIDE